MSTHLAARLSEQFTRYLEPGDYECCVNEPGAVWIDRPGHKGMIKVDAPEITITSLNTFASALAGANDLTITDNNPVLSCTMPGSQDRIEIVKPPACHPNQFIMALRRNVAGQMPFESFQDSDYFRETRIIKNQQDSFLNDKKNDPVLQLAESGDAGAALKQAVILGRSILVCGKFSSGKTVLSSTLLSLIPLHSRIGIIEDVFELELPHQNVMRLSSANDSDQPHRSGHALMRSLMRLTPDRIIVGELRDGLVVQYLKSTNVACDGNISTLHSDNPVHAVQRLIELYLDEKPSLKPVFVRQMIYSAIDLMVFIRHDNGHRFCSSMYFPKYEATL